MTALFAMRRANGDWFALDDEGRFRVPLFHNAGAAMVARSREPGMECFRPVLLDEQAYKSLTTTDGGTACYWLVEDPSMKLNRGKALDHQGLAQIIRNGQSGLEQARSAK